MIASITIDGTTHRVDLSQPMDISIPLRAGKENVNAWHAIPMKIEAVVHGNFVGDMNCGGPVNSRIVTLSPHGNGTHTECIGHITREIFTVNQCLRQFFFTARLISVEPELSGGDMVINSRLISKALTGHAPQSLIIRTLPNGPHKLTCCYSGANPPYLHPRAAALIAGAGIEHLLIDLPSVDREEDGGALTAHGAFWNYPDAPRTGSTITELIYAPNAIADGDYLLHLGVISLESDASPSKPVLYQRAETQ